MSTQVYTETKVEEGEQGTMLPSYHVIHTGLPTPRQSFPGGAGNVLDDMSTIEQVNTNVSDNQSEPSGTHHDLENLVFGSFDEDLPIPNVRTERGRPSHRVHTQPEMILSPITQELRHEFNEQDTLAYQMHSPQRTRTTMSLDNDNSTGNRISLIDQDMVHQPPPATNFSSRTEALIHSQQDEYHSYGTHVYGTSPQYQSTPQAIDNRPYSEQLHSILASENNGSQTSSISSQQSHRGISQQEQHNNIVGIGLQCREFIRRLGVHPFEGRPPEDWIRTIRAIGDSEIGEIPYRIVSLLRDRVYQKEFQRLYQLCTREDVVTQAPDLAVGGNMSYIGSMSDWLSGRHSSVGGTENVTQHSPQRPPNYEITDLDQDRIAMQISNNVLEQAKEIYQQLTGQSISAERVTMELRNVLLERGLSELREGNSPREQNRPSNPVMRSTPSESHRSSPASQDAQELHSGDTGLSKISKAPRSARRGLGTPKNTSSIPEQEPSEQRRPSFSEEIQYIEPENHSYHQGTETNPFADPNVGPNEHQDSWIHTGEPSIIGGRKQGNIVIPMTRTPI